MGKYPGTVCACMGEKLKLIGWFFHPWLFKKKNLCYCILVAWDSAHVYTTWMCVYNALHHGYPHYPLFYLPADPFPKRIIFIKHESYKI